jgi:hypothetical protein
MLAVLGGLADVERDLIRTRTAEGRSRAKAQGKHMGARRSSPTHRKKKHGGGLKAPAYPNSRAAWMFIIPRVAPHLTRGPKGTRIKAVPSR